MSLFAYADIVRTKITLQRRAAPHLLSISWDKSVGIKLFNQTSLHFLYEKFSMLLVHGFFCISWNWIPTCKNNNFTEKSNFPYLIKLLGWCCLIKQYLISCMANFVCFWFIVCSVYAEILYTGCIILQRRPASYLLSVIDLLG